MQKNFNQGVLDGALAGAVAGSIFGNQKVEVQDLVLGGFLGGMFFNQSKSFLILPDPSTNLYKVPLDTNCERKPSHKLIISNSVRSPFILERFLNNYALKLKNTNSQIPKIGINTIENIQAQIRIKEEIYVVTGRIVCSRRKVYYITNTISYNNMNEDFHSVTALIYQKNSETQEIVNSGIIGGFLNLWLGDKDEDDKNKFVEGFIAGGAYEALNEDQTFEINLQQFSFQTYLIEDFIVSDNRTATTILF